MPKRIQDLPEEYESHQRRTARELGERVRARRMRLGLTQEQVRARMELEQVYMTRTQYSRIETDEAQLNAVEVIALRAVLGVSFEWLLLGEPET